VHEALHELVARVHFEDAVGAGPVAHRAADLVLGLLGAARDRGCRGRGTGGDGDRNDGVAVHGGPPWWKWRARTMPQRRARVRTILAAAPSGERAWPVTAEAVCAETWRTRSTARSSTPRTATAPTAVSSTARPTAPTRWRRSTGAGGSRAGTAASRA